MATLHIHLDESGDWKFVPKASKYLILAAAWTYDPRPLAHSLTALRYKLVRDGLNIDSFHASPDKQSTRNQVVSTLVSHDAWRFAAVVMEKRKVNPVLRDPHKFYPTFASVLLKFILRGQGRSASRAIVYADTIPMDSHAKKEGVVKAMKQTCADELLPTCTHHVYSHRSESNPWLQVADYCCWALRKKWEVGDTRTYEAIKARLAKEELELTAGGDGTVYY